MANQGEIVCAAIRDQLDTIEAGVNGYENTPEVFRIFSFREGWVPTAGECGFYVWPANQIRRLGPSSCETTSDLEIHVLMCKRTTQGTESPGSGAPPERWQMVESMFADLCQCVYTAPTFGGTARRLVDNSISVEYAEIEGWAVGEARFTVIYATNRPGR